MNYQTLKVDLADRSYPIFIGPDLITNSKLIQKYISGKKVLIVTNETVAPLYLDILKNSLEGLEIDQIILPDGEQFKTLDTVNSIFTHLLENKHSRKTTLIALGGGVIGDMTGFAAASYQRGVDFIQIPTTLLSQVDSSVGGKTGVNHKLGKNMIGAFKQPKAVFTDTNTLKTLPKKELAAGISEVVKYGLIIDYLFFEWLEKNIEGIYELDEKTIQYAIKQSCLVKADVVNQDELEAGVRALLNLGHTFGHAIETALGYGKYLHGEAVAIGTVMASYLSVLEGKISYADHIRIIELFERVDLPVLAPESMTADDFIEKMSVDKKVLDGKLRLVLFEKMGEAIISDSFDQEKLIQTLNTKNFRNFS
ncbi:MAG: 3-dehydroquinate synthase [Saccharospirillaceae bacterium]|nr:3-dehydroquinate synthase [Pseudomonadales bacterium]NRB78280.1 3-dehydroquinate synthase [Saccharospirillaceae bacterium]